MLSPDENKGEKKEDNKLEPQNEIETVVSKNENMEPVPDSEQLDEKKEEE